MNLNEVAKDVARLESGGEEVNIAQIKEILRRLFQEYGLEDIFEIWKKYNK